MNLPDLVSLFAFNVNPLEIVLRGTVMYWFLFLLFRFLLRRVLRVQTSDAELERDLEHWFRGAILLLLAEAWPRALTRTELIRRLWDSDPPESDPLRTHLYQLRQQLDKTFATPMLHTVHGVGMRLQVAVDKGIANVATRP